MVIKYENSTVYKIIGDDPNGLCYVGSTTEKYIGDRMSKHRSNYRMWIQSNKELKRVTRSVKIFDLYGIENCKIVVLEKVKATSKHDLHEREQFYIDNLNCVNKHKAISWTEEDKKEYHKQYRIDNIERKQFLDAKYYEANKTHILNKMKKEYINKKEIICARVNEYRKTNVDIIRERKKQYAQNQGKATILAQRSRVYHCTSCDCEVKVDKRNRHSSTMKHIDNTIDYMKSTIDKYTEQSNTESNIIQHFSLE